VGRVTLQTVLGKKLRLILTSLAVVLGVAFMAGTFVLTDTLGSVFDNVFASATKGVDAVVRAREPFKSAGQNADVTRPPVPNSLVDFVRKAASVVNAQGTLLRYALVEGRNGQSIQNQAPAFGTAWYPAGNRINQSLDLVSSWQGTRSRQPTGPHDVALDIKTAGDGGYKIGDQVEISFAGTPPTRFRLTGVFRFGGSDAGLAGATLAAFMPSTAEQVLANPGQPPTWDQVDVRAASRLSETQVRDRLNAALSQAGLRGSYESITGNQLATEQSNNIKSNLSFFNTFLLIFALVALFVGAFIIYNTFSITVAQRTQELGLLRALGASGRQVVGSVALEALVVGVLSSVLGLGLGILLVTPLRGLLSAFGISLPSGPLQIEPRTIVVSLLVGTLITMVSALAPARRAARVSPIAAIRDQAIAPSSGRRRYVWGLIVTVVGVAIMFVGLIGGGSSNAAATVGAAAALVFIGVAMLSPLVARPVAQALSWPAHRLHSVTGMLAEQNAIRNPRRTASTAAALMIGLALVSLIAIFGASAKASFASAIDNQTRADFILSPKRFLPFSPGAAEGVKQGFAAISKHPATVVEYRTGTIEIAGTGHVVLGASSNFEAASKVPVRGFNPAAFARGGILIWKDVAGTPQCGGDGKAVCEPGATLLVRFPQGGTLPVPVAGVVTDRNALPIGTSYTLSLTNWEQRFPQTLDSYVVVIKPTDVSTSQAQHVVDSVAARFGGMKAENKAQFKNSQLAQFNQILGLMYVLLLFAVIIALIGIVNTLALSIYERTREIGLLRAVGMTRVQLRRTVRGEAVIVAVFGSLLGLMIGIGFGAAIVRALRNNGIGLSIPVGQLITFVILAAGAGLLAAWLPARRAARLDVLRAVSTE
jgi:putative ABC transport system permease protein